MPIFQQCGTPGFNPWVGKICWRRERLPTPVQPGEFHGLYSPWGHKESDTTERLSLHIHSLKKTLKPLYKKGPDSGVGKPGTSCVRFGRAVKHWGPSLYHPLNGDKISSVVRFS